MKKPFFWILLLICAPAMASELEGCWRMERLLFHRKDGVTQSNLTCDRLYAGDRIVSSCRGGAEIAVYQIEGQGKGTLTYRQLSRTAGGSPAQFDPTSTTTQFVRNGNRFSAAITRPDMWVEQFFVASAPSDCSSLVAYANQDQKSARPTTPQFPSPTQGELGKVRVVRTSNSCPPGSGAGAAGVIAVLPTGDFSNSKEIRRMLDSLLATVKPSPSCGDARFAALVGPNARFELCFEMGSFAPALAASPQPMGCIQPAGTPHAYRVVGDRRDWYWNTVTSPAEFAAAEARDEARRQADERAREAREAAESKRRELEEVRRIAANDAAVPVNGRGPLSVGDVRAVCRGHIQGALITGAPLRSINRLEYRSSVKGRDISGLLPPNAEVVPFVLQVTRSDNSAAILKMLLMKNAHGDWECLS